jgi:hypothetical protein
MKCTSCGTEIADKALICYRCGASTFVPAERPAGVRPPRARLLPTVLALVVLVVAALFMGRAAVGETPRVLGWVLLALAAIIVVARFLRRR